MSEAFYSNLSVDKFKARHSGHDVVSGTLGPAKAGPGDKAVNAGEEIAAPPTEPEVLPTAEESEPLATKTGITVAKVLVDLLNFPSLGGPMVRVRGFDTALEEAFTATMLLEEGARIREMFEKGRYHDQNASDLLYQWEPDVVEYVDDAKAKLEALGDAQPSVATESDPGSGESEAIDQTAVASAAAVVTDTVSEEETSRGESVSMPEQPEILSPSPTVEEDVDVPTPVPPQSTPATTELEVTMPEGIVQSIQPQPAPSVAAKAAGVVVSSRSRETREEGHLLVSKSWYIQGGTGNRDEAVRISKVLKAFRWNVEPLYTIGVMLDDMLSIETSKPQISGRLIKRMEASGYRLTAVVTDKGKPVAWFKREGSEEDLLVGATAEGSDDSEMDLEPDITG